MILTLIILGHDRRHAEAQRDRWLSLHPDVEILREHPLKPEQTLLARIGGKVPRVSMEVEYRYVK